MSTQIMYNGMLTMLEAPSDALFDPNRPTQSISKSLDFIAQKYLHKKMSTIDYVKPAVAHIQGLMEMAKDHEFLQQLNEPELSDKMTDIINLEVLHDLKTLFFMKLNINDAQAYSRSKQNHHEQNENNRFHCYHFNFNRLSNRF